MERGAHQVVERLAHPGVDMSTKRTTLAKGYTRFLLLCD
jgi:hypothetical protein